MQISPHIVLRNNVALAPMSGISDLPFRRAVYGAGAGLVVSEMTACEKLAEKCPDTVRRTTGDPSISPFAVQLAGHDPRWIARGTELAEAAGADIVDINMGCPCRRVTGKLSGSALMRDPDHAIRLAEAAVTAATTAAVTLKMRLGWNRENRNAREIAMRAESAGIAMVTVHARTREDFFSGQADWKAVREVREALAIPLFVNGDIRNEHDARTALRLSGADGIMIGRAALGRPWLPGAVAAALQTGKALMAPPPAIQKETVMNHYREIIAYYGPAQGVRIARKHLAAYIDAVPVEATLQEKKIFRNRLCRLSSPERVIPALEAFLHNRIMLAARLAEPGKNRTHTAPGTFSHPATA